MPKKWKRDHRRQMNEQHRANVSGGGDVLDLEGEGEISEEEQQEEQILAPLAPSKPQHGWVDCAAAHNQTNGL